MADRREGWWVAWTWGSSVQHESCDRHDEHDRCRDCYYAVGCDVDIDATHGIPASFDGEPVLLV